MASRWSLAHEQVPSEGFSHPRKIEAHRAYGRGKSHVGSAPCPTWVVCLHLLHHLLLTVGLFLEHLLSAAGPRSQLVMLPFRLMVLEKL